MDNEIPEALQQRIDRVIGFSGYTRTELIREAIREKVQQLEQHQTTVYGGTVDGGVPSFEQFEGEQLEVSGFSGEERVQTESEISDVNSASAVNELEGGGGKQNNDTSVLSDVSVPEDEFVFDSDVSYKGDGVTIGNPYTGEDTVSDEVISLPPSVLTNHYLRVSPTGLARSTAFINDAVSMVKNTDGPLVYITDTGDNSIDNFLAACENELPHEEIEDRVLHFAPPDTEPGFSLFDISSDEAYTSDRAAAVDRTVTMYLDVLQSVNVFNDEKREEQERLIEGLIQALYDPGFVDTEVIESFAAKSLPKRLNYNVYTHKHLTTLINYLFTEYPSKYGLDEDGLEHDGDDEELGDSNNEDVLETFTDPSIREKLKPFIYTDAESRDEYRKMAIQLVSEIGDSHVFEYIKDNMVDVFDFRHVVTEDSIVLIDLGNLREGDRSKMFTLILHQLWNAITDVLGGFKPTKNYTCNIVLENVKAIQNSNILSDIISQARTYNVGLGIGVENVDERPVQDNAFTEIDNQLFSNVTIGEEYLREVLHAQTDPKHVMKEVTAMPQNQWIAQLSPPEFGDPVPKPFRLEALPLPAGHQASNDPLAGDDRSKYQELRDSVIERVDDNYSLPV